MAAPALPPAGAPQAKQMWCLTLATNAVVIWTTEYHGLAVTALRRAGRDVDDAVLAHIWPTHHENVHFYGTHSVEVDGELVKLDSEQHLTEAQRRIEAFEAEPSKTQQRGGGRRRE